MTNLVQHHATDINVPIGCAEVPIYPGDIMVGDAEGVVCIPRHLAEEVATAAREQEKLERFIQYEVSNGAPLRGTYPPNEDTLERYRESRSRGSSGRKHQRAASPTARGGEPHPHSPAGALENGAAEGKIPLVLKRTSSSPNSQASTANALLPAVDVRGHGSAAMNASQRWR